MLSVVDPSAGTVISIFESMAPFFWNFYFAGWLGSSLRWFLTAVLSFQFARLSIGVKFGEGQFDPVGSHHGTRPIVSCLKLVDSVLSVSPEE